MMSRMNLIPRLIAGLCLLSSCYADGIDQSVPLTTAGETGSLLPSDQLAQVAANCRNDIVQAHQLKTQVPKELQREYAITLGIAAEKCEALTKAFLELQKAAKDFNIYNANLQRAQASVGSNHPTPAEPAYQEYQPYATPVIGVQPTVQPDATVIQQEPLEPAYGEVEPVPLH